MVCVCMDAMNNFFKPASFDVVVGAAILHHLLDPVCALKAAYRALKPGGTAFFFSRSRAWRSCGSPLTSHGARCARESLALDPAASQVPGSHRRLDIATRTGTDKSMPHFRHMDDKWLFTRDWLVRASQNAGFSALTVVPHASRAGIYCKTIRSAC